MLQLLNFLHICNLISSTKQVISHGPQDLVIEWDLEGQQCVAWHA